MRLLRESLLSLRSPNAVLQAALFLAFNFLSFGPENLIPPGAKVEHRFYFSEIPTAEVEEGLECFVFHGGSFSRRCVQKTLAVEVAVFGSI